MPLNLSSGTGSYGPRLQFDAKAGVFTLVKSKTEAIELAMPLTFVCDFSKTKTGWANFTGPTPDIRYDPNIEQPLPQPNTDFKRYFNVPVFSDKLFGGEASFGSQSAIVGNAFNDLYCEWEGDNSGKFAVVTVKGTEPVKGNYGTNRKPLWKIVKWVDKPAAFGSSAVVEEETPFDDLATNSDDNEF